MNFNIKELILSYAPHLTDEDIYHELTFEEVMDTAKQREEKKLQNAKYNNRIHE
ncbi:hypothetical protein LJC68_07180 [Bacteroidales bacterium OttesenSCG-928-B11]|nr:hypothetical protein [Bacteroidales bacterium OttesenSCG-928-C03]MDL2312641.1 hypothetical protein [Bacteroidales bacterium OttesenSCG-928-B11]MDL2326111.1 hypothetical protein [Bacteroidales bacterium OttesenSCG-928-A14]